MAMTEEKIPDDVMEAAFNIMQSMEFPYDHFRIGQAIARAALQERERCAQVALRETSTVYGEDIAEAIRNPK